MITVEAIEKNGGAEAKKIPETKFGSHYDKEANCFYFFESKEEAESFYQSLNNKE